MLLVDLVAVSVKPTETLRASPNRNNGFSTDTDIGSKYIDIIISATNTEHNFTRLEALCL